MAALLVIFTFAVCIFADWLIRRRESRDSVHSVQESPGDFRPLSGRALYVGGFQIREELAFHPGHAWAFPEDKLHLRVGMDDFSAKLIGECEQIHLPAVGDRIVQGQPAWELKKGNRLISVLSPATGRVVDTNPLPSTHTGIIRTAPYDGGWLLRVRADDLRANLNNLLRGDLVRRWMEDTAARLRTEITGGFSLSFSDGGAAIEDLSNLVAEKDQWERLVREFLLTPPREDTCSGH